MRHRQRAFLAALIPLCAAAALAAPQGQSQGPHLNRIDLAVQTASGIQPNKHVPFESPARSTRGLARIPLLGPAVTAISHFFRPTLQPQGNLTRQEIQRLAREAVQRDLFDGRDDLFLRRVDQTADMILHDMGGTSGDVARFRDEVARRRPSRDTLRVLQFQ